MKILYAPAQEMLTDQYASEYLLMSNLIKELSKHDDIDIDAIVGGCDSLLKYRNNIKVFPLIDFKMIMGMWERIKLIWLSFKKAKELIRYKNYDIIQHGMPFKLHVSFNLLFLCRRYPSGRALGLKPTGRKNVKFVIGPITPPHTFQPASDWLMTLGHLSKENIFKKFGGYLTILFIKIAIIPLKWISHLTLKKADAVITMHEDAKQLIAKIVSPEKIVVIPPASNINFDENYIPRTKGRMELLSVGGLGARKNFKVLIEIFAEIKKEFLDANIILRIIGEGPEQENLKKLIKDEKLEKHVILQKRVFDLKEYYTKAHIFCSTSRSEGFSACCLEAMGCGLPIVAMKAGGYTQVIQNEKNGFLAEQGDKEKFKHYLYTLIQDENLREAIGRKAHELIKEKYTWSTISGEYYNLYKKLAESKNL